MRARSISIAFAVVALVAGLLVAGAGPAHAAVIDVTTTADGGAGSLREAFDTANLNGEDTEIVLGAGLLYQLTDCGAVDTADLDYNGGFELTLTGNGSTIEQTCPDRVIEIDDGSDFVVTDVTITGGDHVNDGGGIDHDDGGDLTVVRSTIAGNEVDGSGGGIDLDDPGTVTITDSTIAGNTSEGDGGAINNDDKDLTIVRSTISGNESTDGDGGAMDTEDADVTFVNSTVSGNTAFDRGGALWGDLADITLVNTTMVGNTGPTAANIEMEGGELTTTASVIAAPAGAPNCLIENPTVSGGYNFSDDDSCDLSAATDRQSAGDPELGALADNGGPTQTHLPAATSPLVDQIPEADCAVPDDQRGVTRPQNGTCDIGSVELAEDEPTPDGPVDPANPVTPLTPAAAAVATEPTFTG